MKDGRVGVMIVLVNKVVTRVSVSASKSSKTTTFLVPGANNEALGKPSSNRKLGAFSNP